MKKTNGMVGVPIALAIFGTWLASLVFLLSLDVSTGAVLWTGPAILWQTFLYTGLFITAHDAMHQTVFPQNRLINNLIGTLAVAAYALFSYRNLRHKHWEHHRRPASEHDPDFHDGEHRGFLAWYLHFMKTYVTWGQLVGMAVAFNLMKYGLQIPTVNLILFWISPALLSTVQLFYFGTYLPHREPRGGYDNPHRAQSNLYSPFWSFITCYHFGYHWEHHEHPYIPWWRLPAVRRFYHRLHADN